MPEFTSLRTLFAREGCLTLPGVYDGISACMADSLGFEALYITGSESLWAGSNGPLLLHSGFGL